MEIMMGTMVSICITLPVSLNVYKAIEKTMIISFVHLQRLCNASFAYKILKYEKSTSTKLLEFVQLIQDALPHSKLQKKKKKLCKGSNDRMSFLHSCVLKNKLLIDLDDCIFYKANFTFHRSYVFNCFLWKYFVKLCLPLLTITFALMFSHFKESLDNSKEQYKVLRIPNTKYSRGKTVILM